MKKTREERLELLRRIYRERAQAELVVALAFAKTQRIAWQDALDLFLDTMDSQAEAFLGAVKERMEETENDH